MVRSPELRAISLLGVFLLPQRHRAPVDNEWAALRARPFSSLSPTPATRAEGTGVAPRRQTSQSLPVAVIDEVAEAFLTIRLCAR